MIRLLAVLSLLLAASVRAEENDAEARARAHYEVGLGMYHLGNYGQAIREFTAGYELSPRPEFLINLGQSYRKLHQLDQAREMYRRYLSQTRPDAPDRQQVQDLLAEVDREAAQSPPRVTAPSPATVLVAAPATPPPSHKRLRHLWWIIPTSAVVVGTVLGVALAFGLPPSQVRCADASIGCVDARH
jgi:tetratricopeptide (TPR) repeat protein